MRQIKFRAWDKEKKEWYQPIHEAYNDNLWELMVSFSGDLLAHTMDGIEHQSKWPDRYILMQFTGLLDKHGKEIYEGDVVNYREFIESENEIQQKIQGARGVQIDEIGTVEWDNEGADFSIFLKTGGCRGFNARGEGIEIEIIGSIYENPELLK